MDITFKPIGTIHTPYFSVNTPQQPIRDAEGEFWVSLDPQYVEGLKDLERFQYIYLLYYLHQAPLSETWLRSPSWAEEVEVGVFASRSSKRPNPIGLSIVQIKEIDGLDIVTTGIDVYNGTPLLDIKPYIRSFDLKEDANDGWLDDLPDKSHRISHLLGLPHDHDHDHHRHQHIHDRRHHQGHDHHGYYDGHYDYRHHGYHDDND